MSHLNEHGITHLRHVDLAGADQFAGRTRLDDLPYRPDVRG